jgi:monothiol glutaredoxin
MASFSSLRSALAHRSKLLLLIQQNGRCLTSISTTSPGGSISALKAAGSPAVSMSTGIDNITVPPLARWSLNNVATPSRSSALSKFFSSSSHDDFVPKTKKTGPETTEDAIRQIQQHIKDNLVMLYMKGSPAQPMCGFSATVVKILNNENASYSSVNVLDYPTIREGIKKFSQWPTIPQLYVNGEFIGGCDIVTSMHESGELTAILLGAKAESMSETKETDRILAAAESQQDEKN